MCVCVSVCVCVLACVLACVCVCVCNLVCNYIHDSDYSYDITCFYRNWTLAVFLHTDYYIVCYVLFVATFIY